MDVSIIIPFYKKLSEFRTSILYNYKQFQEVNEIIVIIDEEIKDLSIFSFLQDYNINFKFLMNNENHPWRNPAVVLNKGINTATSDKIIIISPETILLDGCVKNLVENCNNDTFSVGLIIFTSYKFYFKTDFLNYDMFSCEPERNRYYMGPVFYGSICCTKKNFNLVNNYTINYSYNGWGGEDDNIRKKLKMANIKQCFVNTANAIHLETYKEFKHRKKNKKNNKNNSISLLYDNFTNVYINSPNINIALDRLEYLIKYNISSNICNYYPIVALVPCYNEEAHIKDYINHISNFVDGIIFLDDGSSDNSWNLLNKQINNSKIIITTQIKRKIFNDLQNRNYLLEIFKSALVDNNIKVDWIFWMDMDERITSNIKMCHEIRNTILSPNMKADNIYLPLFHMWDNKHYNSIYPYSIDGIQLKLRLIRNRTDYEYKIKSNKHLHFRLTYYNGNVDVIFLQIKHLAYISKELRIEKFNKYTQVYDKSKIQSSYNHIINHNPKLIKYKDDIVIKKVKIKKRIHEEILNLQKLNI